MLLAAGTGDDLDKSVMAVSVQGPWLRPQEQRNLT